MEWYVYNFDVNKQKIEKFNVFNNWILLEDIERYSKKLKDKDEFLNQLRKSIRYCFWSKSEYELIIKRVNNRIYLYPWCGCRFPEQTKIDVTDEDDFEWARFADECIKEQIFYDEAKIDIARQIEFQWDKFSEYVWQSAQTKNKKKKQ